MSMADNKRSNNHHKSKLVDRSFTSNSQEIHSSKESQHDGNIFLKKPYLKKRSGLYRFYKCLPNLIPPPDLPENTSCNNPHHNNISNNNKPFTPNRMLANNTNNAPNSRQRLNYTNSPYHHQRQPTNDNHPGYPMTKHPLHAFDTPMNGMNPRNGAGGHFHPSGNGIGTPPGCNSGNNNNKSSPQKNNRGLLKNQYHQEYHKPLKKTNTKASPKRDSGVEIYEVLDDGNGSEIYCSNDGTIFSADTSFEQGDVHPRTFGDDADLDPDADVARHFSPTLDHTKREKHNRFSVSGNENMRVSAPKSKPVKSSPQDNSEFHRSKSNSVRISPLHCGSGDEEEDFITPQNSFPPGIDAEETADELSQTSEENFRALSTSSNRPPEKALSAQISNLQTELLAMKTKIAMLEKTSNDEETIVIKAPSPLHVKTPDVKGSEKSKDHSDISHDDVPVRTLKVPQLAIERDHRSSTYHATMDTIQTGLDRIDAELSDIQTGFVQKMEGLEEELHIKSQRWCENQIKLADKVHSLFTELEILANKVKAQQHQVQNLAENVEKEFETIKSDWKSSQANLERKIKELEEENVHLSERIEETNNKICPPPAIINSRGDNDTNKPQSQQQVRSREHREETPDKNRCKALERVTPKCEGLSIQCSTQTAGPSFRTDSYVQTPCAPPEMTLMPKPSETEPKIESVGGQIISARKTLPNGDIETVYTNGTREIIKADKSEIRHMYRNGDIRTVSPDGAVTYFYAESSTWQTTYPTGVELFKFPSGVTERRLPNGLIEQTDVDGCVTLFQAAQHKHSSSMLLHAPPSVQLLKNHEPLFGPMIEPIRPLALGSSRVLAQHAHSSGVKLKPGERVIVFENGDEEIHGPDYRKKIFADGTIKTVYHDGSQETRYPNGRIRIKDGDGNLMVDATIPDNSNGARISNNKLVRDSEADANNSNTKRPDDKRLN